MLITHSNLGEVILQNAEQIVGKHENIIAVSQFPGSSFQVLYNRVSQVIGSIDEGQGILVLVDIFGGTPSKVGLAFSEERNVAVVTGLNMAMLLKVLETDREHLPLMELAKIAAEAGTRSIDIHLKLPDDIVEDDDDYYAGSMSRPNVREASSKVLIKNKMGLHASASAKLVKVASGFKSEITLQKEGMTVNTKSIMGVLMLAASKGTELSVRAIGDDANLAVKAIVELFESKFGEE